MMSEEKMQENLNVFLRSSFFVPLLKRMTGPKDELSNEGQESIRKFPGKCSGKRRKNRGRILKRRRRRNSRRR